MKAPFQVSDKVITDYYEDEKEVIRIVTKIDKDKAFASGFRVCTDGGSACPACGRCFGTLILGVDADWFVLISKAESEEKDK